MSGDLRGEGVHIDDPGPPRPGSDPRSGPGPEIDAWVQAVREIGDDICALTEVESDDRDALNSAVPVTREGLMDAFTRTELANIYAFFTGFGPSGRWGMAFEGNFACLAGDEVSWTDTSGRGRKRACPDSVRQMGRDRVGGEATGTSARC